MFIVPLSGDKIETLGGVTYTVLSYTNYKDSPAVYVQGAAVETKSIPFSDIAKINKIPVKLLPSKIFDAPTRPKDQLMLPQKNDKVKLGRFVVKVDMLKLNQRGNLAAGLLIVGDNVETKERVTARMSDLSSIDRADGTKITDVTAFKRQYHDYLGSKSVTAT
jgi:hypothetical protein